MPACSRTNRRRAPQPGHSNRNGSSGRDGTSVRGGADEGAGAEAEAVEELGLGARVETALTDAGIKSVAGLVKKTAAQLRELDGIGDKAVADISEALDKLGLELKGE